MPITKIVSRYQKSIINCSRIVRKVPHRAYLYDNFEKVTKIVRVDILTDFDEDSTSRSFVGNETEVMGLLSKCN